MAPTTTVQRKRRRASTSSSSDEGTGQPAKRQVPRSNFEDPVTINVFKPYTNTTKTFFAHYDVLFRRTPCFDRNNAGKRLFDSATATTLKITCHSLAAFRMYLEYIYSTEPADLDLLNMAQTVRATQPTDELRRELASSLLGKAWLLGHAVQDLRFCNDVMSAMLRGGIGWFAPHLGLQLKDVCDRKCVMTQFVVDAMINLDGPRIQQSLDELPPTVVQEFASRLLDDRSSGNKTAKPGPASGQKYLVGPDRSCGCTVREDDQNET